MTSLSTQLRLIVTRTFGTRSLATHTHSQCAAAEKLRGVFEEYRQQNYSRETPSRFKKELLNAVKRPGADVIEVDSLNRILINIGRQDQLLTEEEMSGLLKEVGSTDRCLKTSQLFDLV